MSHSDDNPCTNISDDLAGKSVLIAERSRIEVQDDNAGKRSIDVPVINHNEWKNDFPIFRHHPNLIYLDSAATSQKPQQVIDAVTNFYETKNANVHRGIYDLAEDATEAYESSRAKIAKFINAKDKEIIFTGNASEAINLVACSWARWYLKKGDIIVLSEMEHHSNIVPWQRLRDEIGVKLRFLPIVEDFRLDYQSLLHADIDLARVKLVTLSQASNVLGTINPIKDIIALYKKSGIDAKYLVDGAQSIPHLAIDVKDQDCDFFVFSSHKMLGPSGIGVLWSRSELLEAMAPLFVGSHMIKQVTKDKVTWADVPWKFEVGTGKLEAAVGLGAAVDYLSQAGMDRIKNHESRISKYALHQLSNVNCQLFGPKNTADRLAVFSFTLPSVHAHDVAEILNRHHVAIRSGHHCAQVLMDVLGVPATARASFSLYNTTTDVDQLIDGIAAVRKVMQL